MTKEIIVKRYLMHPLMTQYLLGKLKKMQISELINVMDQGIQKSSHEKKKEAKALKADPNANLQVCKKVEEKYKFIKSEFPQSNQEAQIASVFDKIRYNFGVKLINVKYMKNLRHDVI